MLAFDDAALGQIVLAASRVPVRRRRQWLVDIARRLEGVTPADRTAADRMQRCRARHKAGIGQYLVEISTDRLALALGEDGFLRAWDDHDPAAIERALGKMVETYIASIIGPDVTP